MKYYKIKINDFIEYTVCSNDKIEFFNPAMEDEFIFVNSTTLNSLECVMSTFSGGCICVHGSIEI